MSDKVGISERITQAIIDCINPLKEKNGGLDAMNYYYNRAEELYGGMVNEFFSAKEEGTKIVGSFCNLVPSELIRAAGAIPIRLCGGFEGSVSAAEKILPRVYCPLIKSTFGLLEGSSPYFDLIDVAVCPTTCDGKKKLA